MPAPARVHLAKLPHPLTHALGRRGPPDPIRPSLVQPLQLATSIAQTMFPTTLALVLVFLITLPAKDAGKRAQLVHH